MARIILPIIVKMTDSQQNQELQGKTSPKHIKKIIHNNIYTLVEFFEHPQAMHKHRAIHHDTAVKTDSLQRYQKGEKSGAARCITLKDKRKQRQAESEATAGKKTEAI